MAYESHQWGDYKKQRGAPSTSYRKPQPVNLSEMFGQIMGQRDWNDVKENSQPQSFVGGNVDPSRNMSAQTLGGMSGGNQGSYGRSMNPGAISGRPQGNTPSWLGNQNQPGIANQQNPTSLGSMYSGSTPSYVNRSISDPYAGFGGYNNPSMSPYGYSANYGMPNAFMGYNNQSGRMGQGAMAPQFNPYMARTQGFW